MKEKDHTIKDTLQNRNANIDLARCISCLGVVGLHAIGLTNYTLYYLCAFSVPTFFMISGYLMFKKEHIDYPYALKKVLSYLRIIFCWDVIITIPIMIIKHRMINPLAECVRSIFQKGYMWQFWYLGAMIIMLLLLPLYHDAVRRNRKLHLELILLMFVSCMSVTAGSWLSEFPNQSFVPQFLRIWISGFYFLVGGFIGCRKSFGSDSSSTAGNRRFLILVLLTVVMTYVSNMGQKHLGNYVYHNRMADYFYDELSVMIWCVLLFMLLLRIRLRYSGYIVAFGKLTLGIYIIHPLLLKGVEVLNPPATTFVAVVKWIGVTAASAVITWVMLKIPYIRKLVEL